VTETAQEGHYPVFLFNRSLTGVYLSLNQGVTRLRNELGVAAARSALASRAAIMAARLSGSFEDRFTTEAIELEPTRRGSLLELYESGHALGKRYARGGIPADAEIREDVERMLALYRLVTARGGVADLGEAGTQEEAGTDESLEERRRYYFHRRVERNRKLAQMAKEIHGCRCQVCGFDFERRYGELGRGYIEAHHKTPLAELPGSGAVSLSPKLDFVVVCANCHRMLHARGAPPFEGFRKSFGETG
jgi:5-methylcytosine-specific restriction protein A